MQTAFKDEIEAIDQAIAEKIGTQKHRVWFKNSTRLTLTGEYVKVGVPNHFIGSWIENHFLNDVNQAVLDVTGEKKQIVFNIDPELSGSQERGPGIQESGRGSPRPSDHTVSRGGRPL